MRLYGPGFPTEGSRTMVRTLHDPVEMERMLRALSRTVKRKGVPYYPDAPAEHEIVFCERSGAKHGFSVRLDSVDVTHGLEVPTLLEEYMNDEH